MAKSVSLIVQKRVKSIGETSKFYQVEMKRKNWQDKKVHLLEYCYSAGLVFAMFVLSQAERRCAVYIRGVAAMKQVHTGWVLL